MLVSTGKFPVTPERILGEGRRPADDPKARRPDVDVSRARIACCTSGIPMETDPGVAPMGLLRVFLCTQINKKKEHTMKAQKQIISYRRRCNLIGQGTGLSHYILLTPSAETTAKDNTK
jgi:hypothetical protein